MKFSYTAYKLLTAYSSLVAVPLIWLHHRVRGENFERFHQRLGRRYPSAITTARRGHPHIWIHAVSVGEVGVAAAIFNALSRVFPQGSFVLSTLREQGLARAKELLDDSISCIFAPLDLVGTTQKALEMVKPDALVLLETEIWPNLIVGASRMGVRIAIVNGRISVRSIGKYRIIESLMRHTLSHVDAFSMISAADAQRIRSLGAAKHCISVNGNAKFDIPDPLQNRETRNWAADLYGIGADTLVFVAGSTRNPEELVVLEAFAQLRKKISNAVLIIAPRHIERSALICQWTTNHGLAYQLRSEIDNTQHPRIAPVVILDTIGELSNTYSIADMVFCGGSLVPKGGQNIMEPALWAKPVVFGPSMEDFAEAKDMIQSSGGGVLIHDAAEMAAVAIKWLQSPRQARKVGIAARQAILPHGGAAQKHADVIRRMLM